MEAETVMARAIGRRAVLAAGVGLVGLAAFGAGLPALAASSDPAAAPVDELDAALLDAMKAGKAQGAAARARRLTPVMDRVFDLPLMTRIAVGPTWPSIPAAKQQALVEAFGRLSATSYAHNFNDWNGEHFEIDPNVQTRGPDKLVTARLVSPRDAPVSFIYRLRQSGGAWKIIDVIYGSISQLTTRRSDFAAPLAAGGADGLIAHLNTLAERQLN